MRAFISINIPCTDKISRCLDDLNKSGIKTGDRSQLHITLKFLGEVPEDKVSPIIDVLTEEVSSFPRFSINFDQLGTFPRRDGSGIVWIGSESKESAELARRIDKAISSLGFAEEERVFKCHVTVARVKSGIREAEKLQGKHEFESFEASSVCLMRSTLTPKGPIYKKVAEIPLKVEC